MGAQAAARKVQLVYRAPESCPPRATFETRLEQRLRGATQKPVVMTVELRRAPQTGAEPRRPATGASFLGTIALSDADGVLGPRAIEAHSCSEAVDALTFVAALLLEDRARAAPDAGAQARPEPPATQPPRARPTGSPRAGATSVRARTEPGATSTPDSRAEAPRAASEVPAAEPSDHGTASSTEPTLGSEATPPAQRVSVDPPPGTRKAQLAQREDEVAATEREATVHEVSTTRPLRSAVALTSLLVSGVTPRVRPGLGLSVGLAQPLGRSFALTLALGLRATWPDQALSSEGNGQFVWWSSSAALCAAVESMGDAARLLLCLDAEAGQIRAHGRSTNDPKVVGSTWLALGPAARTSLRLRGRWRLVPGLGLLVPAARDRFLVGASELHRVSRLTFRAELAVAVEWP